MALPQDSDDLADLGLEDATGLRSFLADKGLELEG